MKKILSKLYAAVALLCLTSLTACSDFLDKEPDTELDLDMAFTNRDKVYSMLSYVYNIIHNPDKYSYTTDGYEVFADDVTPSQRWRQWQWSSTIPKIFGEWTINSTWNGDLWAGMPRYIRQAYILRQNIKALPDPGYTAEDFLQLCQTQRFVGCVCFAGDERLYDAKSYLEKHKKVELDPESKISTRKIERSPYELRCMISYLMEHSIERKHRVICGGFQNDPGYDPACFIQYEDGTQVAMNVRINEPLNEGKRKEWVETTARIPQITFWVDVVPDNPKEKRLYRGSKIHISEHPRG